MTLFNWMSRMISAPDQMDRMMERFGVRERIRERPHAAEVMQRAAVRCIACGDKAECAQWLDAELDSIDEPETVPGFCRNRDLIERLRRDIA